MFKPGDKVKALFYRNRKSYGFCTIERVDEHEIWGTWNCEGIVSSGFMPKNKCILVTAAEPLGPRCGITKLYQKHGVF